MSFENIYRFDQQFQLRISQDNNRSWAVIDGQLCLQYVTIGVTNVNVAFRPGR